MKEHTKHKSHPHDKVAAMPQFNKGHWEENSSLVATGGTRYSPEMKEHSEYSQSANALASYVKSHKAKH